jgi:hypothetical protein
VQQQLGEVLTLEHPRVHQNCLAAIQRWSHWPLSVAFSTWQEAVVVQQQERDTRVRALKFRWGVRWRPRCSCWHGIAWQHAVRLQQSAQLLVCSGWCLSLSSLGLNYAYRVQAIMPMPYPGHSSDVSFACTSPVS